MKVKLIIISIILLLVMVFASGCIPFMEKIGLINPTDEEQLSPEKASPDGLVKVLIGFKQKPGPSEQASVRGLGGEIYRQFTIVNVIAARMTPQAADSLAQNIKVKYVEPDGPVYALGQTVPWGIDRVFRDEAYSFPTWEITKGDGIAVAILDTGIEEYHEDLCLNIFGGTNTIDDTQWGDDGYGHGTHVAGTVAALDNEDGVVGVGPELALYAVKVLDDSGSGTVSSVVAGIEWAVGQNIPVLNMSLGSSSYSQTLQDACDSSYSAGHLLVAAAGNSGNPPGRGDNVIYPAAYDSVIAVAASDSNDQRASFSSTGLAVELIAPGVKVLSTWENNSYYEANGTSMASPHVAGAAALAWSANSSLTNVQIRGLLQETAEDLGLSSSHQGYGLVRADLAVSAVSGIVPPATGNIEGTVIDEASAAIEGATIVVEGTSLSAITNVDGHYLLENVPIGDQEVTASAEGYYSETVTVTVKEDVTVKHDFTLQIILIPTYTVSGTVTDAEGYSLEGATVTIKETDQSDITGSEGTYVIADVEEGYYNITASKDGYSSQTKTVTVEADTIVDFALEEITEELQKLHVNSIDMWYKSAGPNRFVSTKVEIVSSDGTAVSGATVYLETALPDGSKVFSSGNTANDGTVTFEVKSRQTGTYTSTVTDVVKYEWTYESLENVEDSDSVTVE